MLKVAVAGFRHDHILELVNKTNEHPNLELAGCAESDDTARAKTMERNIAVEWNDPMEMIEKLPCDIVGIGDVYAKRGYQIPQDIPQTAWSAFEKLVELGCTGELVLE